MKKETKKNCLTLELYISFDTYIGIRLDVFGDVVVLNIHYICAEDKYYLYLISSADCVKNRENASNSLLTLHGIDKR